MAQSFASRFILPLASACLAAPALADDPVVVILTPPPGTQVSIGSAQIEGLVIPDGVINPVDQVFVRTRYPDGSYNPPIGNDGAYDPNVIGWGYEVEWDPFTGLGWFEGRAQWLDSGINFIDVYLPGDTLGSPNYSQQINFQTQAINVTDVVAGIHPVARTVDVTRVDGSSGAIEFLVDLINTTDAQTYAIDLQAQIELPDGTVIDLPMGGGSSVSASYTIPAGDFSYTSVLDPDGMRFSFPLDQAPFPQPIQEGAYKMEVRCFSGPALIYLDEDIDFWVTDRSNAPFRDVTKGSGLDEVFLQGGNLPSAGNSMAAFDYDNDGLTDLFASNPSSSNTFLPVGPDLPFPGGRNFLMRNNGDGTFTDVTAAAGVEGTPSIGSYGVAWGDANRDGYNDLFVANRGAPIYTYRNNGDGTFTDVAETSFGGPSITWYFAPKLGDVDIDGDYDLFLGNYMSVFDTTWQLQGFPNRLYRNGLEENLIDPLHPDWPLFQDFTPFSGVGQVGTTLSAYFADFDRNGTIDLAVHNDFGAFNVPNEHYKGLNTGAFVDVGAMSGYDTKEFSMGATSADYNGDGYLDAYSTSIGRNSLLINDGLGNFTQASVGSGAEGDFMASGPQADGVMLDDNWGAMSWDFDLDRDWDLYVAGSDLFTSYNMPIAELHPDSVFENDGTASFTRRAVDLGLANASRTHAIVSFDYDLDGDVDVITSAENEGLTLMRNDLDSPNGWLRVRPVTTHSAPGGFNTKLTVTDGGVSQFAEVGSESSHGSSGTNEITFGLGSSPKAEVLAEWQAGGSSTFFRVFDGQPRDIHETLVLIDGVVDANLSAGQTPTVELIGRPGDLAIAAVADPAIQVDFPLPSGGALDIWPIVQAPLFWIAPLDSEGHADWPLGSTSASMIGSIFQFQMTTYDTSTFLFDAKSGVSTLRILP
ncbi:MAG: FG-GAP repeat domain-containing protein [Planctomycetota bacterium]|jgi:hypothetical protein